MTDIPAFVYIFLERTYHGLWLIANLMKTVSDGYYCGFLELGYTTTGRRLCPGSTSTSPVVDADCTRPNPRQRHRKDSRCAAWKPAGMPTARLRTFTRQVKVAAYRSWRTIRRAESLWGAEWVSHAQSARRRRLRCVAACLHETLPAAIPGCAGARKMSEGARHTCVPSNEVHSRGADPIPRIANLSLDSSTW